jgi:hypothetical protein
MFAMIFGGGTWTWVLASLSGTVQMSAPERIRGRVIAFYIVTLMGSMAIGSVLAGISGELIGPSRALALWSVAVMAVGLALGRSALPDVDHMRTPT